MANMHLITGYAGTEHVTSEDQAVFHSTFLGNSQFVFDRGSKLAATVVSNNKIRIADGDIYMQGRHIRIDSGTYVDLDVANGAQGYVRNDLIVVRYTKNAATGIEQANLVVIQGTASTSSAADPTYTTGNVLDGEALQNDMPLYRLPINGLNVGTPVALFTLRDANFENQMKVMQEAIEGDIDCGTFK